LCQAESLAIVPGTIPIASIVADSAEATGLKWAAPASGGGMTQLGTTTTLSGTSTTINITDTGYINLFFVVSGVTSSGAYADLALRYNGETTGYYGAIYADSSTAIQRETNKTQLDTGMTQSQSSSNTHSLFTFTINNYAQAGYHAIECLKSYFTDTSVQRIVKMIGFNSSTAAITSVTFLSATTITGGTVKVYGVK
jgi:hypothetical protein